MSPSQQKLIEIEMLRAWDAYRNAEHDLKSGFVRGANNRLYYSIFYAASALMLAHGDMVSKHTGVRAFFNKEYVKAGKLPVEFGDLYNDLFAQRAKGDYDLLAELNPAALAAQVPIAEQLLFRVGRLLSELGFNQESEK